MTYKGYEAVIGLEIHVELRTREKAFCTCSAEYGAEPDTNCCPICMGFPGTLPALNPEAVRLATVAGLTLDCSIAKVSRFDRKHYFYPDLPKGYQITQYYTPLCTGGVVNIPSEKGVKSIRVERIHLEEDAGKLSYKDGVVKIDHNRCGVPLIEIVTAPDMRSADEAMAFVDVLRRELLFAGVSDCKMNEGSLRCDVNISVRPVGEESFGTRCEIKNINSVNFIGRAIEAEFKRQVDLILSGGEVALESRRFNEETMSTEFMRPKETPLDYRYMREPDLPPVITDEEYVSSVKGGMPETYSRRVERLISQGVTSDMASLICDSVSTADYFDEVLSRTGNVRQAANLFASEIYPAMSRGEAVSRPENLADACDMYVLGEVNIVSAKQILKLSVSSGASARELAEKNGLFILRDRVELKRLVDEAVKQCEGAVREIRRGKLTAKKVIVGCVMKLTKGRADPVILNEEVDLYFE